MNLFVYTITSNEFVCVHNYYRVSDTRKEEQIPDRIINSCVLCTIKPNLDSRNNNQEHQNTASSVRPFFAHSLHLFPLFSSPNASPHTGARHGRGRPSACPAWRPLLVRSCTWLPSRPPCRCSQGKVQKKGPLGRRHRLCKTGMFCDLWGERREWAHGGKEAECSLTRKALPVWDKTFWASKMVCTAKACASDTHNCTYPSTAGAGPARPAIRRWCWGPEARWLPLHHCHCTLLVASGFCEWFRAQVKISHCRFGASLPSSLSIVCGCM